MFYAAEIRGEREYRPDVSILSAAERALAAQFITAMSVEKFKPEEWKDERTVALQALVVEARASNPEVGAADAKAGAAWLMANDDLNGGASEVHRATDSGGGGSTG